jgi:ADP-ribose pyrophosphatase
LGMKRGKGLGERVKASQIIYRGRLLNLRLDEVGLPRGTTALREVVEHPGVVVILPLLGPRKLILVQQYREAVGEALLELPAGTLQPGEGPRDCALLELQEETGYKAKKVRRMFSCFLAPGYSNEIAHAFLAWKLSPGKATPEADESLRVFPIALDKALSMIRHNEIRDAKTIAAILWFLRPSR